MTTMNTKAQNAIFAFFDELFPDAGCELNYHKDYELVLAVMLSAQTTDKSVNYVTANLFSHFPNLESLANAPISAIENDIHSIGLYKHKAANVKGIAQKLISDFSGIVPSQKEALLTLPGVGNKTANVIRAELFKIPEIAVDTHVERVSKRLGFASKKDSVAVVEAKLRKMWDSGEIDTRVGYIYTLKNGKKYQWLKMNGKLIPVDQLRVMFSNNTAFNVLPGWAITPNNK